MPRLVQHVPAALAVACALPTTPATASTPATNTAVISVYVGTYSKPDEGGIHVFQFDPASGLLLEKRLAAPAENPSFLALHPSLPVLYAVHETGRFSYQPGGGVTAYRIHPQDATLSPLNSLNTGGDHPCHLAVDPTGRLLAVANYSGGNAALFTLQPDGRLNQRTALVQHSGSGPNTQRQSAPHPHGTYFTSPRTLLVPDLGIDRVVAYQITTDNLLEPDPGRDIVSPPGSGPRHLALNLRAHHLYVLGELTSTVSVHSHPDSTKSATAAPTFSTLPPGFNTPNTTAEIVLSPDARHLYASNRGHDSIALFGIDPASGHPKLLGHTAAGGRTPRHFALDPTGNWLIAAHQDSSSLQVFRVTRQGAGLEPHGERIPVPKPVCVLFSPGH